MGIRDGFLVGYTYEKNPHSQKIPGMKNPQFRKYPQDFAKSQDFQKSPITGDKNPPILKIPDPWG